MSESIDRRTTSGPDEPDDQPERTVSAFWTEDWDSGHPDFAALERHAETWRQRQPQPGDGPAVRFRQRWFGWVADDDRDDGRDIDVEPVSDEPADPGFDHGADSS